MRKQNEPDPSEFLGRARHDLRGRCLTPAGREALRAAIRRTRPWEKATGPRTPEGKARCALNGLRVRELWRVVEERTTTEYLSAGYTRHIHTRVHANGRQTCVTEDVFYGRKVRS